MACSLILTEQLEADVLTETEAAATSGAGLIGNTQIGWTEISGATVQAVIDDIDDVFAARTEAFAARGDLLYRGAASPAILTLGSTTRLLMSDGTDPVWQNINDLTADATPDSAADYILSYDASAGTHKKVLMDDFPGGGGLSNIVEDVTPQIGGTVGLDMQGQDINNGGVLFLTEQANAEADVATLGQLWVRTATPNELYFTNDAGTDFAVGVMQASAGAMTYVDSTPKVTTLSAGSNGAILQMGVALPAWTSGDITFLDSVAFGGTNKTATFDGQSVWANTSLAISSGTAAVTSTFATIQAESGTADDLTDITTATDGKILLIKADAGDTITVKHSTGNIELADAADFAMSGEDLLLLFSNGTDWHELARTGVHSGSLEQYWNLGIENIQDSGSGGTLVWSAPSTAGQSATVDHFGSPGAAETRGNHYTFKIPSGFTPATHTIVAKVRAVRANTANTANTIDFKITRNALTSDLVTTAPATTAASPTTHTFSITNTGFAGGDRLNICLESVIDDSGGGSNVTHTVFDVWLEIT